MVHVYHTRNSTFGYAMTAGGAQETELNIQTKHCSAKREKHVKGNGQWQWAGCIKVDVCMKFH